MKFRLFKVLVLTGLFASFSAQVWTSSAHADDKKKDDSKQKKKYEDASDLAKKSSTFNKVSGTIHAVNTVICGVSCAQTFNLLAWAGSKEGWQNACSIGSITSTVVDIGGAALVEKSAGKAIGTAVGAIALGTASYYGLFAYNNVDYTGCVAAAGSAIMTGVMFSSASKNSKAAKENSDKAKKLDAQEKKDLADSAANAASKEANTGNSVILSQGGSSASSAGMSFAGGPNGGASLSSTAGNSEECEKQMQQGNSSAFISCAVAAGLLPKDAENVNYAHLFEQATGQKLDDFLKDIKDDTDGSAALTSAFGSKNNPNSAATLAAFKDLDREVQDALAKGTLKIGPAGGARRSSGALANGHSVFDFGGSGSRSPSSENPVEETDLTLLKAKLSKKTADEITASRDISLFDRIALRYRSRDSLAVLPFQAANNRGLNR